MQKAVAKKVAGDNAINSFYVRKQKFLHFNQTNTYMSPKQFFTMFIMKREKRKDAETTVSKIYASLFLALCELLNADYSNTRSFIISSYYR